MGLSRRFLNLIVESRDSAVRSLRRIDLKRLQLFYPTSPPPTTPAARTWKLNMDDMETFGLPSPNPNFRACSADVIHKWDVVCYPLAQRKVLCTDQCGRNFLYDARNHQVATMPEFHRPRMNSLSLFIPKEDEISAGELGEDDDDDGEDGGREEEDEDEDRCGGEGSLLLMDEILDPVKRSEIWHPFSPTGDLEVLFYSNGSIPSHCKLLPPPPIIHHGSSEIGAYAVVGNGSHVCISFNGRGTYVLDTGSWQTWSKVGDWTLPFHGKAEYVPELKLWCGLSASVDADAQHLAAADLSSITTDSSGSQQQPQQLVDGWQEIQIPEEWMELKDPQIVSLGSGRFCIARFFTNYVDHDYAEDITVLTGVEVLSCVPSNGNGSQVGLLKMIPHKSMCHASTPSCRNSIDLVF